MTCFLVWGLILKNRTFYSATVICHVCCIVQGFAMSCYATLCYAVSRWELFPANQLIWHRIIPHLTTHCVSPSVIANEELERFPEMVLGKVTKILKIPIPDSREEMAQLLGNFSKIRVNSQENSREHHKERSSISVTVYKPGTCNSQRVCLRVQSSAHGHKPKWKQEMQV